MASDESIILSEFWDDPDMSELVEEFAQRLPGLVAELGDAVENRDEANAAKIAHQLKGAGGGYGYPEVSSLAGKLEHELRSGQGLDGETPSMVRSLFELAERVRRGVTRDAA
ncbi:MAG: Hpt domain-containing protein [Planctomycetota bacterium]